MFPSQKYYALLDVEPHADLDTIKRAYRQKMRRYHPDQFVAELAQAQQSGNLTRTKQIEKKISNAKKLAQQINSAYAVLSDEETRAAYDRYLSEERQREYNLEVRKSRMRHYESERRTVKSRPHRNPNRPRKAANGEDFPRYLFVGFIVLVIVVTTIFSNAITSTHTPFTTYVPRNPTSSNIASMADFQATTNSQQATVRARETIALQPTATPRSSVANEQIADRLLSLEQYELAVEIYTQALDSNPNNAVLYLKRARAYSAWYQSGSTEAFTLALDDFEQAQLLDESLTELHLERGMLYYSAWLETGDFAQETIADLENYAALYGETSPEIESILDTLSES